MADTDNTQPTTYMLVGADWDGVMDPNLGRLKNVVILRASDYPDIKDAVAQIKPPANVILAAHGANAGIFAWGTGKEPRDSYMDMLGIIPDTVVTSDGTKAYGYSYSQLFKALPRAGIDSITIQSCFGGMAQYFKNIPAGTIVQTMTSSQNESVRDIIVPFNNTIDAIPHPTPTVFLLQALNQFIPSRYQNDVDSINAWEGTHFDSNPKDALPTSITIGGIPSFTFDLNTELGKLEHASLDKNALAINESAWAKSVAMVQENFAELPGVPPKYYNTL